MLQLLLKRGTTALNNAYTGDNGELTVDTQNGGIRLHDGSTAGGLVLPTASDKTKLDGIEANATANASDLYLLSRANHSGTQAISTITNLQTTLDGKINSSLIGANSGVAPLNSSGLIDTSYLPSFVDDVIEAANFAALPGTGETGKIYVTLNDNKTFRWSGSAYVEISAGAGGTADSALVLATPRLINGTSFDGSANITTVSWGTSRTLSYTGDVTGSNSVDGSGNVSFALTLANSGVAAGTYNDVATTVRPFTVDVKGRITSIGTAVTVTPAWASITSKPTTLSGYGITDAVTTDTTQTITGAKTFSSAVIGVTAAKTDAATTLATTGFVANAFSTSTYASSPGWDDSTNIIPGVGPILLHGGDVAGPGGSYYYALNFRLNPANRTQFAIGQDSTNLFIRNRIASTWGNWDQFLTLNNIGTIGVMNGSSNVRIPTTSSDIVASVAGTERLRLTTAGDATFNASVSGVTTLSMSGQLTNTLAIGTAPFVITSTTRVANLNVATAGTADTLTTARTINGTSFNGSANITTTSWGTSRTFSLTGDVTGSSAVDGSTNPSIALTLANSGVTASTYRSVTVDAKGRVTAGTNPTTIAGYGLTDAVATSRTLAIVNGTGITGGGAAVDLSANRSWTLALTGQALAFHNLASNGIVARTAADTVTARSLAVSGTGLSVTNADGVAGNPTITSNATNANTASTIVARDASGNFSAGTITITGSTLNAPASVAVGPFHSNINIPNTLGNRGGYSFMTAAGGGLAGIAAEVMTVGGGGVAAGKLDLWVQNASTTTIGLSIAATGAVSVPGTLNVTGALTAALTGNASTATTLQTTRTIWGQNFNGSANVTGNLTAVGNITGTGGVTLTASAADLTLAATGTNDVILATNGSTRLTLDGVGRLGLGVVPSAWSGINSLDVGTLGGLHLFSSSFGIANNLYYDGANWIYKTSAAGAVIYANSDGSMRVWTAPAGTAAATASLTSRFEVTQAGNVTMSGQFINSVSTGTAPFSITSTTRVANLNVATAGTADTLTTARTINGTSFNGSANITTANWGTSRTITIGSTGKAVDGSGNVSWTIAEIGAAPLTPGLNNQTGTSYTLVLGDAGSNVTMNNAAANTLTIPANASVAFPVGTTIKLTQLGAGQTTVAITTDTLNKNATFTAKLAGQYSEATITKMTSTMWVLSGDLELA